MVVRTSSRAGDVEVLGRGLVEARNGGVGRVIWIMRAVASRPCGAALLRIAKMPHETSGGVDPLRPEDEVVHAPAERDRRRAYAARDQRLNDPRALSPTSKQTSGTGASRQQRAWAARMRTR